MNTDKTYAEKIASEYAPKETRKVVALKKLDNRAKRPANVFAFTFGVVMTLLLGVGMCLSMNVIGGGSTLFTALGIVVGVIGIVGVSVNYAIYKKLLENSKKKYSADSAPAAALDGRGDLRDRPGAGPAPGCRAESRRSGRPVHGADPGAGDFFVFRA